jgi:predicted secreted protein
MNKLIFNLQLHALQGCKSALYLGPIATGDAIAGLTSISNAFTGDSLDITTFDSDCFREFIAGLKGATIDFSGFYDPTDTAGQVALFTAFLAGTKLTTAQKPVFSVDGTHGFTGDGYVTAYSVDASVDGIVNFSASIQLSGTVAVV